MRDKNGAEIKILWLDLTILRNVSQKSYYKNLLQTKKFLQKYVHRKSL